MTDFIAQLIELLELNFPTLTDKIQHGAVDAATNTPFAAFSTPEAKPIRTIHGIAGYTTTFELSLVGDSLAELDVLNRQIIQVVERDPIAGQRCRLVSFSTEYFDVFNLDAIVTVFKIQ